MRKIIREPLLHFLLIGGLIFFASSFISNRNRKAEKTIIISNEKIGSILRFYQIQNGAMPSRQQLDAMIENYIKEEILYRESINMHLDKDDEIIRRRLSQKMEFLQSDLATVPNPTKDILIKFYKDHPLSFRDSGTVSFTHIYFTADNVGAGKAKEKALIVKNALLNSGKKRSPESGDVFSMQYDYTGQNKLDVIQLFGKKPILDSLFGSPVNQWIGPVESGYGWHLIRISERTEPIVPPFESIRDKVLESYMAVAKDSMNKAAFERIKSKYIIQRDYLMD